MGRAAQPRRILPLSPLVAKGAQLSGPGNCQVCHTAVGGRSFAGGRPLETPFGSLYRTNITREAGAGRLT